MPHHSDLFQKTKYTLSPPSMEATTFLTQLLCSLLLLTAGAANANTSCKSAKCSPASPETRTPFRIEALQPHHCGLPGFTLLCTQNKTTIHLPGSSRALYVNTISYKTRKLGLVDPENCVHQVFLNLNLSTTPFRYYYDAHDYRYINCSAQLVGFEQVPCLSGSNHHVYVVEPSVPVPGSCSSVKTVAIPFSYSPYLSGNSFGLALTWRSALDEAEGHPENHYRVLYAVLSIIGLAFILGKLLYASFSNYGSELNEENAENILRDVEIEESQGKYVALGASSCDN